MALVSARLDCLVSSSGADYKAWSGLARTVTFLYVQPLVSDWPATGQPQASDRSDTSQRLDSHKPAAIQQLIRGWLATNWWSVNKVLVENPF